MRARRAFAAILLLGLPAFARGFSVYANTTAPGFSTKALKQGYNAYVVKSVNFQQFVDAVKQMGAFWAVFNEPPPGKPVR